MLAEETLSAVMDQFGASGKQVESLVTSSNDAEAVGVKLETYSPSLLLRLLLFGELIWRISSLFFGQLAALKGSGD